MSWFGFLACLRHFLFGTEDEEDLNWYCEQQSGSPPIGNSNLSSNSGLDKKPLLPQAHLLPAAAGSHGKGSPSSFSSANSVDKKPPPIYSSMASGASVTSPSLPSKKPSSVSAPSTDNIISATAKSSSFQFPPSISRSNPSSNSALDPYSCDAARPLLPQAHLLPTAAGSHGKGGPSSFSSGNSVDKHPPSISSSMASGASVTSPSLTSRKLSSVSAPSTDNIISATAKSSSLQFPPSISRSNSSSNSALYPHSCDASRPFLPQAHLLPVAAGSHGNGGPSNFSGANSVDKKPPSISSSMASGTAVTSPSLPSKKPSSVSAPSMENITSATAKSSSLQFPPSISKSASPALPSKSPTLKSPTVPIFPTDKLNRVVAGEYVSKAKPSIPQDSSTKFAEKILSTSAASPSLTSASPSLLSLKTDSHSPAPPTKNSSNRSVSKDVGVKAWVEKKPTSIDMDWGRQQKLPSKPSSPIKLPSPEPPSSSKSSPSCFTEQRSPNPSEIKRSRMLPKNEIPKHLEQMFKNDIVPPVLMSPLSPSNYADYFGTLLHSEDYYVEKWSKYLLHGVELELKPRRTSANWQGNNTLKKTNGMLDNRERDFVSFEIDSVPERRPFLLSRDFVFLQPLDEKSDPFKGRVFRVVKSTTVLVEFEEDFHSQHTPWKRYDVSFSFNRVCLKRAHQAISLASNPSLQSILFPDEGLVPRSTIPDLHGSNLSAQLAVTGIANHGGPVPYVVEGPPSVSFSADGTSLSTTGAVIREAILRIHRTNPCCRILVCSPSNKTSDELLRSLRKEIPQRRLFRANATYREFGLVPGDIIPACLYEEEEECFACPPLADLLRFDVITSTFMSSYRLHAAGMGADHFTHVFLVDASAATEPEAIVPLAFLAGQNTVIVVSGSPDKFPAWVRADIARRHGLKRSYFHRLIKKTPPIQRSCIHSPHHTTRG